MELKDFIKNVLVDLTSSIKEIDESSPYKIQFDKNELTRTVEFDIAVTTESYSGTSGGGGIKVLQFIEAGAKAEVSDKNSTVSRIKFGVQIDSRTKEEVETMKQKNASSRIRRENTNFMT